MPDNIRHGHLTWWIGALAVLGAVMAGCASRMQNGEQPARDLPTADRVDSPTARVDLTESSGSVQSGRELFISLGCMGCHMVNGKGGQAGPDLSNKGGKGRSRPWLQTQIRNPKANDPRSIMPAYSTLSDEQVASLVDYLQSLSAKGAPGGQGGVAAQSLAQPHQTATAASLVTTGGKEWSRRCGQCHNLRPPSEYDDMQWAVAMHHMRVRVPLTGEEQRSILAFLQASN